MIFATRKQIVVQKLESGYELYNADDLNRIGQTERHAFSHLEQAFGAIREAFGDHDHVNDGFYHPHPVMVRQGSAYDPEQEKQYQRERDELGDLRRFRVAMEETARTNARTIGNLNDQLQSMRTLNNSLIVERDALLAEKVKHDTAAAKKRKRK